MFLCASAGVILFQLYAVMSAMDLYPYQTGAFVALVLVVTMSFYMYSICQHYLEILITEEK